MEKLAFVLPLETKLKELVLPFSLEQITKIKEKNIFVERTDIRKRRKDRNYLKLNYPKVINYI